MGGFNGGTSEAFLRLSKTIRDWTDIDLNHHVIPLWHDESMLNRYMINYMQTKQPLVCPQDYMVPEEFKNHFLNPKVIILDKKKYGGHDYLRAIDNNSDKS